MQSLPDLDGTVNRSPHVIILGAGASRASFINGDTVGPKPPMMNDIIELVGLDKLLKRNGINFANKNFEALYDELATSGKQPKLVRDIKKKCL